MKKGTRKTAKSKLRKIAIGSLIGGLIAAIGALVAYLNFRETQLKNAIDEMEHGNPTALEQLGKRGITRIVFYVDPAGSSFPEAQPSRTLAAVRALVKHRDELGDAEIQELSTRAAEGQKAIEMLLDRVDVPGKIATDSDIRSLCNMTCAEMLLYALRGVVPSPTWPATRERARAVVRALPANCGDG